jgi:hypothetical protein
VSDARITYTPRSDATPAGELNALAFVYAFVLQKHQERQKAAEPAPEPDGRDNTNLAGNERSSHGLTDVTTWSIDSKSPKDERSSRWA